MAKSLLFQQFQSLLLTKEDKSAIKSLIDSLTSDCLSTYKLKLYKEAGLSFTPSPKPEKPNLQALRKLYLETFEKSLAQNKAVAMKFIKDQKLREKRKLEREEGLQRKAEEDLRLQEQIKSEIAQKKQLEKEKRLKNLQELSEQRKAHQACYRETESPVKVQPKFKQIEEDYYANHQMPELQRRKRELELKRQLFKPISLSEIREHAEKSKRMLEELQNKKRNESCNLRNDSFYEMRTKFTQAVIEEDNRIKQEEVLKQVVKKQRAEKKKKYAKLVTELYHPSIDKFKEQEMKLIKARLEFPVKYRIRDVYSQDCSNCSRSFSVQPKKWKKNSMIPEPPTHRPAKKVLYLEERRKMREKSLEIRKSELEWENEVKEISDTEEKMNFLKNRARIFDRQMKKYELRLERKSFNLEVAEHVDDLLINSIRAKLNYLQ